MPPKGNAVNITGNILEVCSDLEWHTCKYRADSVNTMLGLHSSS